MTSASTIDLVSIVDAEQLPYVGVVAASIAAFAGPDRPITYHVLYNGPETEVSRAIGAYRSKALSVQLRPVISRYDDFGTVYGLPSISLIRLDLPQILDLDRVLYLDADLLFRSDIAALYDTPLNGMAIASMRDYPTLQTLNGKTSEYGKRLRRHFDAVLKFDAAESADYVNTGVMLMDLACLRAMDFSAAAFEFVTVHNQELPFRDQDVLNALLKGKVSFLDPSWNVMRAMLGPFRGFRSTSRCIHFAGPNKPWLRTQLLPFAPEWWAFAEQSPAWPVIKEKYRARLKALKRIPNPLLALLRAHAAFQLSRKRK